MEYVIIVILIACSALFSGLTLGIMGLDLFELKRKKKLGDRNAAKIYPLRKRGNELLTALLLGNVAVNSIVAIFLGSIASGVVAGIVATALIFLFGEIIPQAVISRHAMRFGALTAPLVHGLLFILYPVTKPIAMFLDRILGAELPTLYNKRELALLVAEHEDDPGSPLDADEERIIHGALRYSDKRVREVMTPRENIFLLKEEEPITNDLLVKICEEGFSRIPLYRRDPDDLTGFIHVRDLLGVTSGTLGDVKQEILIVPETTKLDDMKNLLLDRRQHFAAITTRAGAFAGIIALEDILEEVIGREIMDEDDEAPGLVRG